MNCTVTIVEGIHVIVLAGELDARTSPLAEQEIMPLAGDGRRILLDMSGVSFMSSAGLRVLLSTYRHVSSRGGVIALSGLSEELRDTMSMTGFLAFFAIHDDTGSGVAALRVQA
jgi:anti-sigma B factor antagonist